MWRSCCRPRPISSSLHQCRSSPKPVTAIGSQPLHPGSRDGGSRWETSSSGGGQSSSTVGQVRTMVFGDSSYSMPPPPTKNKRPHPPWRMKRLLALVEEPTSEVRSRQTETMIKRLELHRPDDMNSLNETAMKQLTYKLNRYRTNFMAKAVVLEGGESAFCSGLDITTMYGKRGRAAYQRRLLARLAASLAYFPKPVISLMDGCTIGGGYAMCQGRYQVATEKSSFFVVEPSFGLGLEGGLSYTLANLRGGRDSLREKQVNPIGTCLALTGLTLTGGDLVVAGLASNFFADSERFNISLQLAGDGIAAGSRSALRYALEAKSDMSADLDGLKDDVPYLDQDWMSSDAPYYMDHDDEEDIYGNPVPQMQLERIAGDVSKTFDVDSVEIALEKLKTLEEDWAVQAVRRMESASPLALKVVFEQLRRAKSLSFTECLEMEYRANNALQEPKDFAETVAGIIAANEGEGSSSNSNSSSSSRGEAAQVGWGGRTLQDVSDSEVADILDGKPGDSSVGSEGSSSEGSSRKLPSLLFAKEEEARGIQPHAAGLRRIIRECTVGEDEPFDEDGCDDAGVVWQFDEADYDYDSEDHYAGEDGITEREREEASGARGAGGVQGTGERGQGSGRRGNNGRS